MFGHITSFLSLVSFWVAVTSCSLLTNPVVVEEVVEVVEEVIEAAELVSEAEKVEIVAEAVKKASEPIPEKPK